MHTGWVILAPSAGQAVHSRRPPDAGPVAHTPDTYLYAIHCPPESMPNPRASDTTPYAAHRRVCLTRVPPMTHDQESRRPVRTSHISVDGGMQHKRRRVANGACLFFISNLLSFSLPLTGTSCSVPKRATPTGGRGFANGGFRPSGRFEVSRGRRRAVFQAKRGSGRGP